MKKYELKKGNIEISYNNRFEIVKGCTQRQDDIESELIAAFDNKEAALAKLGDYATEITELSGGTGIYYLITEYYVEENEYDDDDDEWISGGDIWSFSKMEIEVVSKPEYETVGTFNNFKDAETCLSNIEDGYLKFC